MIAIVSGGQTGVDQAALRAARALGLPRGGWCPPGRAYELNVAGPSEGRCPGVGEVAYALLVAALDAAVGARPSG